MGAPVGAATTCESSSVVVSLEQVVDRVDRDGIRYVFVGERHAARTPKRFVVDLVDRLIDRGFDTGLYVEGFRTDCPPLGADCRNLARLFNIPAFSDLLATSRAPVRPIDPPENDRRAGRMSEVIAAGPDALKVILVGNSHVVHAGSPDVELWVFGGGALYPDPGDLVEIFPRDLSLTLAFEGAESSPVGYSLRRDGCYADYVLVATEARGDLTRAP